MINKNDLEAVEVLRQLKNAPTTYGGTSTTPPGNLYGTGTYDARVNCINCGFKGNVQIRKGTRVALHSCPTCGCTTLSQEMSML